MLVGDLRDADADMVFRNAQDSHEVVLDLPTEYHVAAS